MKKRVLITGAGGFIGGFIVEESLRRGYETWAAIRKTTSRKYLTDERINLVELDLDNNDVSATAEILNSALPQDEKWDYIVYNLGATKCTNFADFNRINNEHLISFIDSLKVSNKVPEKFLFMSSLSALGPGDEKGYSPFTPQSIPSPNTKYGVSKLKAEMNLTMSEIPYIIFRSTGVYGPREKDYFLMFKSIKNGFDFSVGYRKQLLSFIYVEDLACGIFDALEKAPVGRTYIAAEEKAYTQKEFRSIVAKTLGKKIVIPMIMPLWIVYIVSVIAEKWGVLRMKPSTLNRDKFNIMKQRNWSADISAGIEDFGFNPKTDLTEGVRRSIEWYKENKWL